MTLLRQSGHGECWLYFNQGDRLHLCGDLDTAPPPYLRTTIKTWNNIKMSRISFATQAQVPLGELTQMHHRGQYSREAQDNGGGPRAIHYVGKCLEAMEY